MIAKKYKLTSKDISYIFRKQNVIGAGYFSVFWIPQYPSLQYNQWAVNIPLKFSKKSAHRNQLKRIFYDFLQDNNLLSKPIGGDFKRFFVVMNKKGVAYFKDLLLKDKKNLKVEFVKEMDKMTKRLVKFRFSKPSNGSIQKS